MESKVEGVQFRTFMQNCGGGLQTFLFDMVRCWTLLQVRKPLGIEDVYVGDPCVKGTVPIR